MFQVNFSEQSMHELNQLDTRSQMLLVEVVSTLRQEQLDHPSDELGASIEMGAPITECARVNSEFTSNNKTKRFLLTTFSTKTP